MNNNHASTQSQEAVSPDRHHHRPSVDQAPRDRRFDLGSVSRLDVQEQISSKLSDSDSSMQFDSHDVDANDDRRRVPVQRRHCAWHAQGVASMADCHRAQRNDWCTRNADRTKRLSDWHQAANRNGQALIEMAFLIPLLVIIIGATISFGLFFYQANTLQQAVDVAAMEISRFPFSATAKMGLGDLNADHSETLLMDDTAFKQQIYDETHLIISVDDWDSTHIDALPLLNRLLTQVMVRDDSGDEPVYRYPGAIVNNHEENRTVLIPIIGYANDGTESILEWVSPVEEIRPGNEEGPFSITATNPAISFMPGMVALRINYPAQSTTLMNRVGEEGQVIVNANDSDIADGDTGSNYSLVVPAEMGVADTTIHSGRFGLGRQAAGVFNRQTYLLRSARVRPYRKVISVQAIYRREVFQ